MRKLALLLILVMLATLAQGQTAKTAKPASNDVAQLTDIENKWNDALLKPDTDYIDSITAPGYVSTEPDAKLMTKSEMLDALKTGKLKFESFTMSDMKAHVYGDTAVVTAVFTEKGVQDGKPFADSGRYTDTFIKKDGKWLAVATHASLKPAKAGAKPAPKKEQPK